MTEYKILDELGQIQLNYHDAVDYAVEHQTSTPPQTVGEFVAAYPGDMEGMSVYACTLLLRDSRETYALGEKAAWVWSQVERRQAEVVAVLYAGDDRNAAIDFADSYNRNRS